MHLAHIRSKVKIYQPGRKDNPFRGSAVQQCVLAKSTHRKHEGGEERVEEQGLFVRRLHHKGTNGSEQREAARTRLETGGTT